MKNKTATEVIIILDNGFLCPLTFLNRVEKDMLFIAPGVPQGVPLTVKQLSCQEYYATLSDWYKTLAGACMDHLVEHGQVPFENVPRKGRNPYPLQFRVNASYTPNL